MAVGGPLGPPGGGPPAPAPPGGAGGAGAPPGAACTDAEARAAYALLDAEGTGGKVPIERAASRIAGMTEVLPLPGLEAESSPEALGQLLTTFDLEEEGCASFKSFARIVMRSSPPAW